MSDYIRDRVYGAYSLGPTAQAGLALNGVRCLFRLLWQRLRVISNYRDEYVLLEGYALKKEGKI